MDIGVSCVHVPYQKKNAETPITMNTVFDKIGYMCNSNSGNCMW